MLSEYKGKSLVLCGDGRCDSPGKSAKYCTYSLMESESNKILHVETIDKREVNLKSPNMEREAFKRSMDYLISRGIKISEVVTDASPTVISTTGNYNFSVITYFIFCHSKKSASAYPDIQHSLDVWHKSKKIKKGLVEVCIKILSIHNNICTCCLFRQES